MWFTVICYIKHALLGFSMYGSAIFFLHWWYAHPFTLCTQGKQPSVTYLASFFNFLNTQKTKKKKGPLWSNIETFPDKPLNMYTIRVYTLIAFQCFRPFHGYLTSHPGDRHMLWETYRHALDLAFSELSCCHVVLLIA